MIRTHDAGALRAGDIGTTVTLAGWVARRRDHGGVAFLDLRERSGVVQVVVRDPDVAGELRNEYCIKVVGTVAARPAGNENADLPTGAIEVIVEHLDVLSEAAPLPFPIDEHVTVSEEARLRHRYLDLRRTAMQPWRDASRPSCSTSRPCGRLASITLQLKGLSVDVLNGESHPRTWRTCLRHEATLSGPHHQ